MKRLVSILLLVFVVATGFAQSSTPDYIQKAKVGLNQYYPQFKDYFEPIFAEYNRMGATVSNIFNTKIHENFQIFDEELTTDRDKCATILTAMDDILGDKTYINSKKVIDNSDGVDLINGIANEIANDIKVRFSREFRESRERLAKSEERLAKAMEKSEKIKKLKNAINANNANPKPVLLAIEELLEVSELSEVKVDQGTQEIIKYYISISQKANHTPSPTGQKFVDEYNRITKSK